MASVDGGTRRRREAGAGRRLLGVVPRPIQTVVVEVGEITQLLGRVVASAVRRPVGYWADTRDEMYTILKRCIVPATFAVIGFTLLVATFAVALLLLLGAPNRVGALFLVANIRDFAGFLTGMVVAGVVGTAITADLGARRIREELDALRVLGIDPVRMLVLPKVLAMTLITPLLNLYSIFIGSVLGNITVVWLGHTSSGSYNANLFTNLSTPELWGTCLKLTLTGLIMAVVCCQKGLSVGGGPEGVGRAVNHAVVICFAAVFVINTLFNATLQGLNPDMQVLR